VRKSGILPYCRRVKYLSLKEKNKFLSSYKNFTGFLNVKKQVSMRILLVQTAFLGDVILTTPLISAIKAYLPQSELSIVVKSEAKAILKDNPDIKEIFIMNKTAPGSSKSGKKGGKNRFQELKNLADEIQSRNFDILLSVHKSHRTGLLAAMSRIPLRIGFSDSGFAGSAYNYRIESFKALTEIERLLYFLYAALPVMHHSQFDISLPGTHRAKKSSFIKNFSKDPQEFRSLRFYSTQMYLYETPESEAEAEALINLYDLDSPILIGGSSVWPTKRWTEEGFASLILELLKKSRRKIALIGSAADAEISEEIIRLVHQNVSNDPVLKSKAESFVINLCGKTGLNGLYSLMKRSHLLISNDSSPVHFACAARIPVISIFGPTVTSHGYAPLTPESRVVEIKGLDCRPCGNHGGMQCPRKHFLCMRLITPAMILKKVEEVTYL
jgi:heptosyltransferase II